MVVSETEQQIVERARALAKLQAKRRTLVEKTAEVDLEIQAVSLEIRGLVPTGSDK